ncbi:MAG: hypothetical protein DWI28_06175 [Planctomycetota bacterium]|nr:MAG: hypothetical protein DWI28_06175 [Planctomycetota bacterium]
MSESEVELAGTGDVANCTLPERFDVADRVPDGLVHVDLPRLGPTCKRLGIEYSKAIVGWNEFRKRGERHRHPVTSGVVIREADHDRLLAALADKKEKERKKAEKLPVLAALFTLNRRAKRCRDLAQGYYQKSMHGFAGDMKQEKKRIYFLKGQVLHHHVEAGVLVGGKYHRFEEEITWAEVLEGQGYRFHRPCPPQGEGVVAEVIESVEAKPKTAKEPTLKMAYQVVEAFLADKKLVSVYQWPARIPSSRYHRWEDDEFDAFLDDDDYPDNEWA